MSEIKTNRCKAIIASNMCSICGIAVMCISKIACNEKGVNGFDIVVFEILFSLMASFMFVLLFMNMQSLKVQPELRVNLFVRCLVGLVSLMSFTVGAALTSITI